MTPVKRHVGTDIPAILGFIAEAGIARYPVVYLATDAADALIRHLGAPTSTASTVIREEYLPPGMALALPPGAMNMWGAVDAFAVSVTPVSSRYPRKKDTP